jgi:hypothetical protein
VGSLFSPGREELYLPSALIRWAKQSQGWEGGVIDPSAAPPIPLASVPIRSFLEKIFQRLVNQ